ncbi:WAP four-disulfide core domain protein 3-like [Nematolebias whitei]|uniref:WAP four-disulfide core domain protein 3-like n=1 Tax=Nematolebias whitei TaxID=451745 RepID=UPI00189A3B8C|nr:WAP four-disulfide core domain protein 3-like [Nematolebias whitei]
MKTHCSVIAVLLMASCLFVPSYSVPIKPGICPNGPPWIGEMLPIQLYCDTDWNCPDGQKCCWHRCVSLIPPPVGKCPVRKFGPCIEACGVNRPCRAGKMCCPNGCGQQCMTPVPELP